MRIELPSSSWAEVHRAQDDAHTLTLPAPRALSLAEKMLAATDEGETARIAVPMEQLPTLTLTL